MKKRWASLVWKFNTLPAFNMGVFTAVCVIVGMVGLTFMYLLTPAYTIEINHESKPLDENHEEHIALNCGNNPALTIYLQVKGPYLKLQKYITEMKCETGPYREIIFLWDLPLISLVQKSLLYSM